MDPSTVAVKGSGASPGPGIAPHAGGGRVCPAPLRVAPVQAARLSLLLAGPRLRNNPEMCSPKAVP